MKCYQYDSNGYFVFVEDDYGQGLPHNATYIEPPKEKEGYLRKFNKEIESWEFEEIPQEETSEIHIPTQQELLDQLNVNTDNKIKDIAMNLSIDVIYGAPLTEAQEWASADAAEVSIEYAKTLQIIKDGGNPF